MDVVVVVVVLSTSTGPLEVVARTPRPLRGRAAEATHQSASGHATRPVPRRGLVIAALPQKSEDLDLAAAEEQLAAPKAWATALSNTVIGTCARRNRAKAAERRAGHLQVQRGVTVIKNKLSMALIVHLQRSQFHGEVEQD